MDIVEKCNAGIVIDTNSHELSKALVSLEELNLEKMGNNARKLAEKSYNNIDCTNRLFHIYEDLFTGNRTSPDWINLDNVNS